jgi:glucose-6-phosphate isomerase
MKNLFLDLQHFESFIHENDKINYLEKAEKAKEQLVSGTGKGNDFIGWLTLPDEYEEIQKDLIECSLRLRKQSEVIVIVGIGGSYLGAKAVIEALSHSFNNEINDPPRIVYAGHNLSEDYHSELLEYLDGKKFSIVVISKSGTTTEPAIAFRILKEKLASQVKQEELKDYIVAITDKSKGALRTLADKEGYQTFIIPDNVGGRFSVLTPVGLLPVALAGFDTNEIINGAKQMKEVCYNVTGKENPALLYAALRNIMYDNGLTTEILVNYNPKLSFVIEWWKQLYGESEGKEGKGIFPSGVNFTTDLHSLGQYIQDGKRNLFETVLSINTSKRSCTIPQDKDNLDKLNYLADKNIDYVNKKAELGTIQAHNTGKVPNIRIEMEELNENTIGQLIYFFEFACAVSGYILDVNPFDQPGVEAYKKNMFQLLGKPE